MNFSSKNPKWQNRDRWILSNGHGSALQYVMLHLSGYNLTIEDLKQFRQLDSKTPGHPENFATPGVEVCYFCCFFSYKQIFRINLNVSY